MEHRNGLFHQSKIIIFSIIYTFFARYILARKTLTRVSFRAKTSLNLLVSVSVSYKNSAYRVVDKLDIFAAGGGFGGMQPNRAKSDEMSISSRHRVDPSCSK